MNEQKEAGDPGDLEWHAGDMPYSAHFGDHYYSRADGRAECGHVFLAGNGLPERWRGRTRFVIGELGFGTGLNAVETWRVWQQERRSGQLLEFHSFERYPLPRAAIVRALSAWPELRHEAAALVALWPDAPESMADIVCRLDDTTILTVHVGDAAERLDSDVPPVDAWYLDGFAPARNPEMWSAALMEKVRRASTGDGTFATYTAAGWVRRNLTAAGFLVEKRPGHAGKREMMCGRVAAPG